MDSSFAAAWSIDEHSVEHCGVAARPAFAVSAKTLGVGAQDSKNFAQLVLTRATAIDRDEASRIAHHRGNV